MHNSNNNPDVHNSLSPEDQSPEKSQTQDIGSSDMLTSNQPTMEEVGGRKDGLDPTRYGDWEKKGRCIDF